MSTAEQDSIHSIDPARTETARLVQITDCHLFEDADGCLFGLNTRQSLAAVCAAVPRDHGDMDALLATGDLSQDGSAESYRYLALELQRLAVPVFWLPGNHDDADCMKHHFRGAQIHAAKRFRLGNWQILLLDSTLENEIHGKVSASQLDFMDNSLDEFPELHALICLHHQAIDIGSRWIDQKGLRDSDQLRTRIAAHDNVRAVLWGHVHQEFQASIGGVEWLSTPSSCVQFKPGSAEFATDDIAPGYRSLSLHADGSLATEVHRIEAGSLRIERSIKGY